MNKSIYPKKNKNEYSISQHNAYVEALAKFVYKGFIISFSTLPSSDSTLKASDNRVELLNTMDNSISTFSTVEQAVQSVEDYLQKEFDRDTFE